MAFSNALIWEDRSTGATTSGGGFNPASANFATDLTTDTNTANTASPVASSASYNFVAGDVGAWLFIQSGTNWTPGWYQIASVASNKATLTAGIGTAVLYGTDVLLRNYHRPNGLNTVAGCATVGTPTGGVWGVDYSQQAAAAISYTDMVVDPTTNTNYSSIAFPVGKNIVGNVINITAGVGFTVQRVEVISTAGTVATVDKSLGTLSSVGGTGNLGGAVGSTAVITALSIAGIVAGSKIYRNGTCTVTTSIIVTAGAKGDGTNGLISFEGYASYRGDNGRVTVTSATNSINLFTWNDNDFWEVLNVHHIHTAGTRGAGMTFVTGLSTPFSHRNCIFEGVATVTVANGFEATHYYEGCEVMNCTSTVACITVNAMQIYLFGCDFHDNSGDAVRHSAGSGSLVSAQFCVFDTNVVGINSSAAGISPVFTAHGCIFVDNTSDGIKIAATSGSVTLELENNIFYGNGGYGINNLDEQAVADANMRINRNNAFGSNSSGARLGVTASNGAMTLTADPFTNKAGRDFSLNNTAGGGAVLRAAAFPTTNPSGTTTNYQDVGMFQHQDAGGGGSLLRPVPMSGGLV